MSEQGRSREDRIRERAYSLWEEDGRPEGREHEHWEQASGSIEDDAGDGANGSGQSPTGETRQSGNAGVDQLTPSEATAATMRDASAEASTRSGAEPEAKSGKPL